MILTFKVKHNKNFAKELEQAKKIALFAINNRHSLSSKNVKHIGLKSAISNQILRKYGLNRKCKAIRSVKLIIPNPSIRVDQKERLIRIPCLKLELNYQFKNTFAKVNQIEIDNVYAYVSCWFEDGKPKKYTNNLGVDLNTTGHCAVVAIPKTGKVYKLGKKAEHIHKKYNSIRKNLQKQKRYKLLKKVKNRESRIIKDLNHKISKKIIDIAEENKCNIKLENLKGIRRSAKVRRSFKYALNSWSFYQLQQFIEYKAKQQGLVVLYIAPEYTSKSCSRCGHIGNRNDKIFKCPHCGHVDHADAQAAFNIAKRQISIDRLNVDRDAFKGNTDIPRKATSIELLDLRTPRL